MPHAEVPSMAVTRSWTAPGSRPAVVAIKTPRAPRSEWLWLMAASLFVAAGLAMVFAAKSQDFAAVDRKLAHGTSLPVARPAERRTRRG